MKRGFTLVEMLIVVVVLVTLMTIAFRLSSIGGNQSDRSSTIARMQRLENCISGYYAAFGTYPPVHTHGSRNIYLEVDSTYGLQKIDANENKNIWGWNEIGETSEYSAWQQVRAACRAQPVACLYPFADEFDNAIKVVSEEMKRRANSNEPQYKRYWGNPDIKAKLSKGFENFTTGNALGSIEDSGDWRKTKVFQFGLMSFLLPRYLFMMGFADDAAPKLFALKQWNTNNAEPHSPFTGSRMSWQSVRQGVLDDADDGNYQEIANIASQAVCARWMPNLEHLCSVNYQMKFFGITIGTEDGRSLLRAENPYIDIYTSGENGSGTPYVLDGITVLDGWGNEFFYYSPPPYQTYTLWSAGANWRTFPPWIDRKDKDMDARANKCISKWIEDDIIHLSN